MRLPSTTLPRLRDWRAWLLLLALACTVALYSVEATHNHRTAADDLRCPVCHVLGHNALDSATPDLKPALLPALLGFVLLPVFFAVPPRRAAFLTPPPRAPPTR
ncbi:MAG TPA: hypothetical protein VGM16_02655 [Gammaproteobacteria bacterium]|jgi:hypothetical protein